MKSALKALGTKILIPKCGELLSSFAFNSKLRRYSKAADGAWRDHFRMMFQRECNRETKSGNDKALTRTLSAQSIGPWAPPFASRGHYAHHGFPTDNLTRPGARPRLCTFQRPTFATYTFQLINDLPLRYASTITQVDLGTNG